MNIEQNSSIPLNDSAKFVSGIDALYFYAKVDYNDYSEFYNNFLLKGHLEEVENLEKTSFDYTKQFTYFTYYVDIFADSEGLCPTMKPLVRIGFKNLNTKDNLDSIYLQMDSATMNYFGYSKSVEMVLDYLRFLSLEPRGTKASRVDLNTYVLGHNFEYLTSEYFSTKARKSGTVQPMFNSGKLETFYMGTRSTDSVFMRIYNKNKQLSQLLLSDYGSSVFKELLLESRFSVKYGQKVDIRNNLWNVEFEVKRGTLRRYNIDTVEQLFVNLDSIHNDIVNNTFRMLERKKDQKNNQRIKTASIWKNIQNEYRVFNTPIPIQKEKLKVYKKDRTWMINRMIEFVEEVKNEKSPIFEDVKKLLSIYS